MKADELYASAENIRAFTPYILTIASVTIAVCAMINSERLVGERFAYTMGVAGAFLSAAATGYNPQSRQVQTRVGHADQVEIDQSR